MIIAKVYVNGQLIKSNSVYASLTSRLNSTPPIGDPKATDIPAAAAAERTSRFRAVGRISKSRFRSWYLLTFVAVEVVERFHEEVRTATRHMYQWALLSKP